MQLAHVAQICRYENHWHLTHAFVVLLVLLVLLVQVAVVVVMVVVLLELHSLLQQEDSCT